MLYAYRLVTSGLEQMPIESDLKEALWIDLLNPLVAQVQALAALGVTVPTLADMEEIEVSNRLYREGDTEVLTVVLPGLNKMKEPSFGPVAFLITPERLVTVRYHTPRPFETFAAHAGQSSAGCSGRRRVFLGLVEEIVARLADLLEGVGKALDQQSHIAFRDPPPRGDELASALRILGRQSEQVAKVRHALLTVERALSSFGLGLDERGDKAEREILKALVRDCQALAVHGDFLSARVSQLTDVNFGLINLEQSNTSRIFSVVAVLFMPPTLVASVYGMNFPNLPGIENPYGYYIATVLMIGSGLGTYLLCKWKKWL
ncbi:MAG: magnesium transporter CorA family protein [Alphaproteobacteria bacterium]|nr:magnesium transporter CorA family protein [Alphaproteobacteria bacterium]MBU1575405.1 magnesium transporter CorA family protein [Alphaproteobacteria bacterium]MBU2077972.1 magnesium transporter CorA family protein [Alphaproteobacteria bacterium]MBU2162065.1 magnesium transporter CorA family protein [Alphaproteobacteria bacterium]MBU2241296.1 magnesium transporter CorA family protein [Alphaproteobacteria bacterium]